MIENINVGSTPNDNTGDTLRDSFIKINNNDNYLDGKFDDYVLTDLLDVELGIINTEIADINTAIDNLSDVFVSGGTYLDGTATFVNTTGGTFDVSGFSEDTKYQISASQVDANVKISLSGSDLSSETIVLIAGDNITLTDDGSNNITIDAAGGGGPLLWTVDMMNALSVDVYAPYSMKITTITDIFGTPSMTIDVNGAPYTLGTTIVTGDKITFTAGGGSGVSNITIIKL